jgi:predicted anti-sigma-YlaC factor YlaD
MRCRKIRKKLPAFLEGEIGDRKRERIASHLEICVSCGEEAKVLSSLSVLLREEKESIKASPYFWNKLEQRIIQAETNKNAFDTLLEWLNRTLIPASATAVVVIGLFIGICLGGIIYTRIAPILNPDNSSLVQQEMNQSLHLSTLNDFPQESIGEIYIGLLAENNLPK